MELATTGAEGVRRTRRFRSPEERCRIVEETLVPGVSVALTPAQLSMLLEGIDWRRPVRTAERVLNV
jgi:transposase-like protein